MQEVWGSKPDADRVISSWTSESVVRSTDTGGATRKSRKLFTDNYSCQQSLASHRVQLRLGVTKVLCAAEGFVDAPTYAANGEIG